LKKDCCEDIVWLALDDVERTYGEFIVNVTLGRMGELLEEEKSRRLLLLLLLLLVEGM